jgi:hypothetical protein
MEEKVFKEVITKYSPTTDPRCSANPTTEE